MPCPEHTARARGLPNARRKSRARARMAPLAALLLLAGMTPAWAQTAGERADQGEQILLDREQSVLRERLRNSTPDADLSQPDTPLPTQETRCFPIDDIRLEGVSLLDDKTVARILAPFRHSCLGEEKIKAMIGAIDKAYAERGYITTRAYLHQQNLSDRVLTVTVIEGTIEAIALEENGQPRTDRKARWKLAAAFPFAPGDPLDLRAIEQGIDQMGRVRSDSPTVDLKPGENPGGTVLVVHSAPEDTVRGIVSFDNDGADTTGRFRIRTGLEADNLIGLNDTLALYFISTIETNAASAAFSVPWGYWTFSGSASYSDQATRLTPTSDLTTRAASGSIEATRLLYRGAHNRLSASLALSRYHSRRHVNTTRLSPQELTLLRAGLEHEWRGEGQALFSNGGLTFGLPILGSKNGAEKNNRRAPQAEFVRFDASLSYIRALNASLQYYGTLYAQTPIRSAMRSEAQLSIGGWSSVRGYNTASASGDRGVLLRNELSLTFDPKWGKDLGWATPAWNYVAKHAQPYVFFDMGRVYDIATSQGQSMAGTGLGMRFAADPLDYEFIAARSLGSTKTGFQPEWQLFFNLTWSVF